MLETPQDPSSLPFPYLRYTAPRKLIAIMREPHHKQGTSLNKQNYILSFSRYLCRPIPE